MPPCCDAAARGLDHCAVGRVTKAPAIALAGSASRAASNLDSQEGSGAYVSLSTKTSTSPSAIRAAALRVRHMPGLSVWCCTRTGGLPPSRSSPRNHSKVESCDPLSTRMSRQRQASPAASLHNVG